MNDIITAILGSLNHTKKVCIQAGHFAILENKDKNATVPGIWEDLQDELASKVLNHPYMGHFPTQTWKAGLVALTVLPNVSLALLVNDWQFVRQEERNVENPYRKYFYENQRELPASYRCSLEEVSISPREQLIVSPGKYSVAGNELFFSEVKLRNQFVHKLKATCSLKHGCAQEYLPFLLYLKEKGFDVVINYIPTTCMQPILESSMVAQNEYGMDNIDIINVFANGAHSPDIFWENALLYKNGERMTF